jgi:hypothetical protein
MDFPNAWRAGLVVGCLVAFLTIRSVALSKEFMRFDEEVQRDSLLFNQIEPKSVVAVAIDATNPEFLRSPLARAFQHVASLAALHAPVFVGTTHAIPSQDTIVVRGSPFSDLYDWQRQLPIEVGSAEELNSMITRYHKIMEEKPGSSQTSRRKLYLLLLEPYTMAETAGIYHSIVGRTKSVLLIRLNPADKETAIEAQ